MCERVVFGVLACLCDVCVCVCVCVPARVRYIYIYIYIIGALHILCVLSVGVSLRAKANTLVDERRHL